MKYDLFETEVLPLFEGSQPLWIEKARDVARELGVNGAIVTIDMVRDKCPPPSDVDPRIMGSVFLRKEWERIGYASSSRSISHNRPIAMMKLKKIM